MVLTRALSVGLAALLLASCSGNTDRDDLDKTPPPDVAELVALNLSFGGLQHEVGTRITASAEALYDDGTSKDVTADVAWAIGDMTLLEVGLTPNEFVVLAEGRVSITGVYEGESKSVDLQLTAPSLDSLELFPPTAEIGMGAVIRLSVVGVYSDGTRETITDLVDFESDTPSVLRPSESIKGRLVTFGTEGSAEITVRFGAQVVRGTYTVGPARIFNLAVSTPAQRIGDEPVQLNAEAAWTDARTRTDETTNVQWVSSDPSIVSVDANGVATRVTDGTVVITATLPQTNLGGAVRLKTLGASVCGDYPEVHAAGVRYGEVIAPMFWRDAYNEAGEQVDFFLEDLPCDTETYQTVLFVVGAGWCGVCPGYKRMIDALQPQLEEAGMRVVWVEAQDDGGSPASNAQANGIVNRTLSSSTNPSIRIGDGDAEGGAALPFVQPITGFPTPIVVRTSDMVVIAIGQGHNFLNIANNPDQLYGDR
ncbi:MAG: Ig-like domain-containing protein [Deltaproteobacteria bacterium]|jgi:thiol-disulfide isomerase/thioredoxin